MNLSRDLMLGMLRRGSNGDELMRILELIVSDLRSEVCEAEGIADCPENEGEIVAAMAAAV
jgi:hypothetical protein